MLLTRQCVVLLSPQRVLHQEHLLTHHPQDGAEACQSAASIPLWQARTSVAHHRIISLLMAIVLGSMMVGRTQ